MTSSVCLDVTRPAQSKNLGIPCPVLSHDFFVQTEGIAHEFSAHSLCIGSVGLHHVDIREFLTGSEELTQLSFSTFVLVIFLLLLFWNRILLCITA